MTALAKTFSDKQALTIRLMTGLVIGLLIATIQSKLDHVSVSQDFRDWFPSLSFGLAVWAPIILAGVGSMRRTSLVLWALVSFALIFAILALEKATSGQARSGVSAYNIFLFPLLFIGHELVSSGDLARNWIAPFETYFEEAWKRGVQLALAIVFTALLWGILYLGAALLGFIGFDWFSALLEQAYFSFPATGLAFGAAVHLGDVQTKLLSNVRALVLGVLSWLLPVITLIGAIFAVSLLRSGLASLWATKAATATLLGGCIGFVLLINAAYQQGDVDRQVSVVLKWSARGAAILLLIFAVLAAWSLSLRIGQYGLSPDRVLAGLGVVIALAYGLGYSAALFVPGRWMALIEPVNITLAIFKCVLFIAILTPIASPNRLSVNDQVARLDVGKVSVEKFDWWLLNDDTGKYGRDALQKLTNTRDPGIANKAKLALANQIGERPYGGGVEAATPPGERPDLSTLTVVYPKGSKLPKSFLDQDFTKGPNYPIPLCLNTKQTGTNVSSCKVALIDLNRDQQAEILIREAGSLFVFTQNQNIWVGQDNVFNISGRENDFDAGNLRAAPALWDDLLVADRRVAVFGAAFAISTKPPVAEPATQPATPNAPAPPSK